MRNVDRTRINCDEPNCSWGLEIKHENVPEYHNKSCPNCGGGVLVNDVDLAFWEFVTAALQVQKQLDPNDVEPKVTIKVDTASLRKP